MGSLIPLAFGALELLHIGSSDLIVTEPIPLSPSYIRRLAAVALASQSDAEMS